MTFTEQISVTLTDLAVYFNQEEYRQSEWAMDCAEIVMLEDCRNLISGGQLVSKLLVI